MGETNKLTDKMYLQNSINSYREEHTAISKTESVGIGKRKEQLSYTAVKQ